jgi:hypothetical protein
MNRNNNERFSAPQMPEELMRQLMASSIQQQNQNIYQTPTELVELPSKGAFYPPDHPLYNVESIEIKMMTTKEEDILTSPTFVEKGVVFDKLLESIILDKRIHPSSLLTGDRNAILTQARISAYGPEYSFSSICQGCSTVQKVDYVFENLKTKELPDNLEFEDGLLKVVLPKSKAVLHLKFLTGQDEKEIQQEQSRRAKANLPEEQLILMYRKLIAKVNGNDDMFFISNFVSSMPVLDSRYIRKIYSQAKPDLDLTFRFECKKCGNVDEGGVVSISGDFFWPQF